MGQQEVADFLQKNKKRWYKASDICKYVDATEGSVRKSLVGLRRRHCVEIREVFERGVYVLYYRYSEGNECDLTNLVLRNQLKEGRKKKKGKRGPGNGRSQ